MLTNINRLSDKADYIYAPKEGEVRAAACFMKRLLPFKHFTPLPALYCILLHCMHFFFFFYHVILISSVQINHQNILRINIINHVDTAKVCTNQTTAFSSKCSFAIVLCANVCMPSRDDIFLNLCGQMSFYY